MLQKLVRESYFKFDEDNKKDPKICSRFIYERFDNISMIIEDKIENYDWNRDHDVEYYKDVQLKATTKNKGLDIAFTD